VEQFVEQLERLVEAEASRAGAAGDDALQLQAPVGGGAHPARHADGARARRRRRYRHGRRSASLRVGGAEQVECDGWAEQPVPRRGGREGASWTAGGSGVVGGVFAGGRAAPGVATAASCLGFGLV